MFAFIHGKTSQKNHADRVARKTFRDPSWRFLLSDSSGGKGVIADNFPGAVKNIGPRGITFLIYECESL